MASPARKFDNETNDAVARHRARERNAAPTPKHNAQQKQADNRPQAQPQPVEEHHVPGARASVNGAGGAERAGLIGNQGGREGGERVGRGNGDRGGGGHVAGNNPNTASRMRRTLLRFLKRLSKALLGVAAAAFMLLLAVWCLTVDAPHSPRAQSRPEVTWAIGESRVAAVIAPFVSAATYGRFLNTVLTGPGNVTLPEWLKPISPPVIAEFDLNTTRLKVHMLTDADDQWQHMLELDQYIYADIENAGFFQRGGLVLNMRLFIRRSIYYVMLWAGAPSPEPPTRTARRRIGELQTYMSSGVATYDANKWRAVAIREHYLRKMQTGVVKQKANMRHDSRPRDATREERDEEAAISVISELLDSAAANSSLADDQFSNDTDVFVLTLNELKRLKKSLSTNDSVFEGSWGGVFESGAKALDVLLRLEELVGMICWLLAELEEPQLQS